MNHFRTKNRVTADLSMHIKNWRDYKEIKINNEISYDPFRDKYALNLC